MSEGLRKIGERSAESTKLDSHGIVETEASTSEPAWVCMRPSAYIL